MSRNSNYEKHPCFQVTESSADAWVDWRAIVERLRNATAKDGCILAIECYPGAFEKQISAAIEQGLRPAKLIHTGDLLKSPRVVDQMLEGVLGDDPVFGRMNDIVLQQFFDDAALTQARQKAAQWNDGRLVILGEGATLVAPNPSVLVYADMARWEIQGRQRRNEIANFGSDNLNESPSLKYKRSFFVDWRAADRLKIALLPRIDFYLDTNGSTPKMVSGRAVREGLKKLSRAPFRVVPYFDPGPWGGHWMEEVCDLPHDAPNHAWCFDCVPEENSLLLGFGRCADRTAGQRPDILPSARVAGRLHLFAIWRRVPDPFRFSRYDGRREPFVAGAPENRIHSPAIRHGLHAG